MSLSTVADNECFEILAELKEKYNNKDFCYSGFESCCGKKIPVNVIQIIGTYSDTTNKDLPDEGGYLECAVVVYIDVFELTEETEKFYSQLKFNPNTSSGGTIIMCCYSVNGKLNESSIPKLLPHELIHGIQNTKGVYNDKNGNYEKARKIRLQHLNEKNEVDKIIADLFWVFDKREMDANLHKFVVDYRDVLSGKIKETECDLYKVLLNGIVKLERLKKIDDRAVNDCLRKYECTSKQFIKRCQKLISYVRKKMNKIKYASKSGQYPTPNKLQKIRDGFDT